MAYILCDAGRAQRVVMAWTCNALSAWHTLSSIPREMCLRLRGPLRPGRR